jgi:hypothetical protein
LKYSAFVKIAGELAIPKSLVLPVMQWFQKLHLM